MITTKTRRHKEDRGFFNPNVPPLPGPLLHFMEEREVCRGYPGGSVNAPAPTVKPAFRSPQSASGEPFDSTLRARRPKQ